MKCVSNRNFRFSFDSHYSQRTSRWASYRVHSVTIPTYFFALITKEVTIVYLCYGIKIWAIRFSSETTFVICNWNKFTIISFHTHLQYLLLPDIWKFGWKCSSKLWTFVNNVSSTIRFHSISSIKIGSTRISEFDHSSAAFIHNIVIILISQSTSQYCHWIKSQKKQKWAPNWEWESMVLTELINEICTAHESHKTVFNATTAYKSHCLKYVGPIYVFKL